MAIRRKQKKIGWLGKECLFLILPWFARLLSVYVVTKSLTLQPIDYSLPGSSVQGILQARILEWGAIFFSRGSSQSRDQTHVFCIGRRVLYHWATWEVLALLSGLQTSEYQNSFLHGPHTHLSHWLSMKNTSVSYFPPWCTNFIYRVKISELKT